MKITEVGVNYNNYKIYIEFDDKGTEKRIELSDEEALDFIHQLMHFRTNIKESKRRDEEMKKRGFF